MKVLTFDTTLDPKSSRHFNLLCTAINSATYQFQSRDEMRHHSKLLDAMEATSIEGEGELKAWRKLNTGTQQLVVDDAWLALLKKMATPPNVQWLPSASREVGAMLDFLDAATDYVAPAAKTE